MNIRRRLVGVVCVVVGSCMLASMIMAGSIPRLDSEGIDLSHGIWVLIDERPGDAAVELAKDTDLRVYSQVAYQRKLPHHHAYDDNGDGVHP